MARDYVSLGSTPHGEDCAQVGQDDYRERARAEIRAFAAQIIRECGEPPLGASLVCKGFPHDFGTYYELCAVFNDTNDEAGEWAYKCEDGTPEHWDEQARADLAEAGFPVGISA
jgi:hypothetical protein